MIKFLKSIYFNTRFFYVLIGIAILFMISNFWNPLYGPTWIVVIGLGLLVLIDVNLLYKSPSFTARRRVSDKLSNGDVNTLKLELTNRYAFEVFVEIIDEIPVQFQKRDFLLTKKISSGERAEINYGLRPVERGEYVFGKLNCYVSSQLKLVKRRYSFEDEKMTKVYPSIIQMKKYDFLAIDNRINQIGLKKIRRIGHTMEFEQIKEYVRGDDVRTLNWKATAKRAELMVNQYQDEKSQPVYSVINTGRVMKMPFEGLKLVDYAINSTLAFSNIALKKNDKVGLITYSHQIDNVLAAKAGRPHLNTILEALYKVDTEFLDSDLGRLYSYLRRNVRQRSLVLFYTNFEHLNSLNRQLAYFKAIARRHLLVVIFFENTELKKIIEEPAHNLHQIYDQTIATQFAKDKETMVKILNQNGIHTILTPPQKLTISTINKYLELKARALF